MTAFFGIDEREAKDSIDRGRVYLPHTPDGRTDVHAIVAPIRNEDIVFIKHCTPQSSLHIKAVGVVQSEVPIRNGPDVCLPVEWIWQGEKILDNLDEVLALCGDPLYEEHNITVQREIIDLLPDKYHVALGR